MLYFNLPIIDQPINTLLSQRPSVLMVIVVISPAEHHQAFRLGIRNEGKILQQLLSMGTDSLQEQPKKSSEKKVALLNFFKFISK